MVFHQFSWAAGLNKRGSENDQRPKPCTDQLCKTFRRQTGMMLLSNQKPTIEQNSEPD